MDVVPLKTCSYDCIYCQLGRTTDCTVQRKEWVSVDEVVAQLEGRLSSNPDYITLSGSGEPTLFSRIGDLVERIKSVTDIPLAVLTNGSLLWDETVRREVLAADLVVPSLDASDESSFRAVNRPHSDISFEQMLDGLVEFRREFRGQYWLEVFVLEENTSSDAALARLVECVERIGPDRVQLNTVTRPPAESFAVGLPPARLAELAASFRRPAEVIADFRGVHQRAEFCAGRQEILEMLQRRPCSIDDIAGGLDMHRNMIVKYLGELAAENLVEQKITGDKRSYRAKRPLVERGGDTGAGEPAAG